MAVGGMWHRTLVYFGLSDEDEEFEDDATQEQQPDVESTYRHRPNVRKIERSGRRRSATDFDEIYSENDYRSQRAAAPIRPVPAPAEPPQVRVHLVTPKNFNDAQVIADKFKGDIPVILNLQGCETELAKRLIDFASGLTYALDGGMQRVADKVFLLTPKNVEVSAEERQRLVEKGFFNQF
jgi:cell division inhibitor SepF